MKVSVVSDAGVRTEIGLDKVEIRGVPLINYLNELKTLKEDCKRLDTAFATTVKKFDKSLKEAEDRFSKMFENELRKRDKQDAELEQRFLKIWRSVK